VARISKHDRREIELALHAVMSAETTMQLRQCQAILIPALTGASIDLTAEILGLSRNRVIALRRQFRDGGGDVGEIAVKRGGRRRALMSLQQESGFLSPWMPIIHHGGKLAVAGIHRAYEDVVGRKVPKSTIYRLLARHGWRSGPTTPSISL
jgi:transposase